MKSALTVLIVAVIAWMGFHSQSDTGHFRIVETRIEPVDDNPVRRLLYRKPILLTFDDGPSVSDSLILAALRKHHARALWLVNCEHIDRSGGNLREIAAAGQLIGNHTFTHPRLDTLPDGQLDHQITGCSQAITAIVGEKPKYFRPPFGVGTPAAERVVNADGMQSLLWSSNSFDSLRQSFKAHPQQYVDMLRTHTDLDPGTVASAGDVVLLHDYPNTAVALDAMLGRLEARGFQFVVPD